jgi:hypothetical protein
VPRGASLADSQPAGASRSLQGSKSKKQDFDGNVKQGFRYTNGNGWVHAYILEFLEQVVSKALY